MEPEGRPQSTSTEPETVLVLAPSGRDATLTRELLEREGLSAHVCEGVRDLCEHLARGAGTALLPEEVLTPAALQALGDEIARQPLWSDFPIILFSRAGGDSTRTCQDVLRRLGNVTFLDRPVQVRTMLAAVVAAIRARRKQYESRRAIQSRDQFLAMLGHELRNPLGAVRLAVELFESSKDEGLRQRQIGVIDRQSLHLGRLVDDLLDVARVTYGKVVLHPERLDFADIVRGCFNAHEPSARVRELTFTFAPPASPLWVQGDRLRLEQIVANLLTNAIKYTRCGGSVRVAVEREGGRAVLRVADSGIGIAPEMLPRVFELFTQADRTLDRAQGGMGLGLTVVRSLVHLHEGEVEARSEGLGKGSEFVVSLPVAGAALPARPNAVVAPVIEGACRVVLVEDNEDIRTTLEELLTIAGHEVATASTGPEGVETIRRERPDIAFVDIGLPGFDGFELARRVRTSKDADDVRLVAVSGYGQAEDRRRAREAGFDSHLTKPVGLKQLEAAMRQQRV